MLYHLIEVIGIETVEIQLQRYVVGMNFGMTPTHSLNFASSSYTDMYMIDQPKKKKGNNIYCRWQLIKFLNVIITVIHVISELYFFVCIDVASN